MRKRFNEIGDAVLFLRDGRKEKYAGPMTFLTLRTATYNYFKDVIERNYIRTSEL
jgi:hypothetical protein